MADRSALKLRELTVNGYSAIVRRRWNNQGGLTECDTVQIALRSRLISSTAVKRLRPWLSFRLIMFSCTIDVLLFAGERCGASSDGARAIQLTHKLYSRSEIDPRTLSCPLPKFLPRGILPRQNEADQLVPLLRSFLLYPSPIDHL